MTLIEKIGNTPLVELKASSNSNRLLGKIEGLNPGGSSKDRATLYMLNEIKEDNITIVEATSGNTGISLSMLGAYMNIPVIIVMPENMSSERIKMIENFGAKIILTKKDDGMSGSVEKARELLKSNSNMKSLNQFENPANNLAHYMTTGPEIWKQTDGKIDVFVSTIGTGGTLTGTAKYLKEKNPDIKIIGVEPEESPLITKGFSNPHKIQGIGANFIPQILDLGLCDEIVTVSYEESIEEMKYLSSKEGLFVGISSGTCLRAMRKIESNNLNIVGIFPDRGERYLSII